MRILPQTIIIIVASTSLAGCLGAQTPFQTQSGLRICILRQGKGPKVVPGAEVEIHEITSLMNGEVVISSYERGYPLRFCQGRGMVIKGVDEAVAGMKAGEIRSVIVPPHLSRRGYRSKNFAPDDTLNYRLELVRIVGSSCSQPTIRGGNSRNH